MFLILLLLAACGDEEEEATFEGVYQTASHTRNLGGCAKEGPPFDGDTYFKLSKKDGELRYHSCESAESCQGVNASRGFTRQVDSEWVGVQSDATKSRGACDAQLTERVMSRLNGDNIQIETRLYKGGFEREDGQECGHDLVVANRDKLSCERRDIVKAAPVE